MSSDEEARLNALHLMAYNPTIANSSKDDGSTSGVMFKFVVVDDNSTITFTHYIIDGEGGCQEIIPHIKAFHVAIQEANLDEPSKVVQHRKTIIGDLVSAWDSAHQAAGNNASFDAVVPHFLEANRANEENML